MWNFSNSFQTPSYFCLTHFAGSLVMIYCIYRKFWPSSLYLTQKRSHAIRTMQCYRTKQQSTSVETCCLFLNMRRVQSHSAGDSVGSGLMNLGDQQSSKAFIELLRGRNNMFLRHWLISEMHCSWSNIKSDTSLVKACSFSTSSRNTIAWPIWAAIQAMLVYKEFPYNHTR